MSSRERSLKNFRKEKDAISMLEGVREKIQRLQGRIDKMIEKFEEETDLMIENVHINRVDDGLWNDFVGCEIEVKFRPISDLRREGIVTVHKQ